MSTILEVLKQRSFESPQQRVALNVLYTSSWLRGLSSQALKPFGITWQQFNLLRILRGQRGVPASMRLLQERMLDPQSNASRLVDKLEAKGLVLRDTSSEDKRRVSVILTAHGEERLQEFSTAMSARLSEVGGDLSEDELVHLSDLLDRLRA